MPARNRATRSSASSPSRPCVSRSTPAPPCPPTRRERGGAARHSGRPGCCRHIRGFPGGRVLVKRVAFPSAPLERAARPCQPEPPGRTVEGGGDAVLWSFRPPLRCGGEISPGHHTHTNCEHFSMGCDARVRIGVRGISGDPGAAEERQRLKAQSLHADLTSREISTAPLGSRRECHLDVKC